jgi:Zn ribbon nucleic-acid-binding protein
MREQWLSDHCPKCKLRTSIAILCDDRVVDIDGIQCYNCGHRWKFEMESEFAEGNEFDESNYEKGVHFEERK